MIREKCNCVYSILPAFDLPDICAERPIYAIRGKLGISLIKVTQAQLRRKEPNFCRLRLDLTCSLVGPGQDGEGARVEVEEELSEACLAKEKQLNIT